MLDLSHQCFDMISEDSRFIHSASPLKEETRLGDFEMKGQGKILLVSRRAREMSGFLTKLE